MSLGRGFGRLWTGNALANLADGLAFVAIPLLAAALTSDPVLVAGLAAIHAAIRLLVVLPVGVYVDRLDRRTILWATNAGRGALLAGLALATTSGQQSLVLLYVVYAALGVLETAADNAALSVLPSIVPAGQLDRANGRVSAAQLVADEFVGPPLGGFLFGVAVAVPLFAMGGLYAAAAAVFLLLPQARRRQGPAPRTARASVLRDAVDGARWLRCHRLLGGLAVVGGLASLAYLMPFSVLVLHAQQRLGLDATGYGVLLAVSAVGGLVGSLVAAPVRARIGYGRTIVASLLLAAVTMIGLALTRSPWVAGALLAGYILHAVVWGICVASLRQRLVPDHLRGRVNASSKLLSLIGLTVGAVLGGVLAASIDLTAPFVAAGAVFIVCVVVVAFLFRPGATPVPISG